MLQNYTCKSVQRADLPKIVQLLAACETVDQLESNRSLAELQRGFDNKPPNTLIGRYLWETPDGQPIGYAVYGILDRTDSCDAYPNIRVHPDHRHGTLEAEMLAWCEQEIYRLRPNATLWAGARCDRTHYTNLYESQGYQPVRWFNRMERSLADSLPTPQFPVGFIPRQLQGETDVEPWVEMFNHTFVDHWNFHPITIEDRRHHIQRPTFQPDLSWIVVDPTDTFAGFCTGHIFKDQNNRTGRQEGWIVGLGTRRGFRRKGLGRAMLLFGLHQLKKAGMETALLGVDSENPNQAQQLYTSAGFKTIQTSVSYTKEFSKA